MHILKALRQSKLRVLCLWLLIAALMLRAFIPVGFMPDLGRIAGTLPITICSAYGAKTILIAAADSIIKGHKSSQPEDTAHQQHDCVLCAAPVQATGDLPAFALHVVLFFVATLAFICWLGIHRRRYEAAACPRGPPAFA